MKTMTYATKGKLSMLQKRLVVLRVVSFLSTLIAIGTTIMAMPYWYNNNRSTLLVVISLSISAITVCLYLYKEMIEKSIKTIIRNYK